MTHTLTCELIPTKLSWVEFQLIWEHRYPCLLGERPTTERGLSALHTGTRISTYICLHIYMSARMHTPHRHVTHTHTYHACIHHTPHTYTMIKRLEHNSEITILSSVRLQVRQSGGVLKHAGNMAALLPWNAIADSEVQVQWGCGPPITSSRWVCVSR